MTIATAVKPEQGYSCDLRDWLKEVKRLEQLRRELRAEIVPYTRGGELVRRADLQALRFVPSAVGRGGATG